MNELCGLLDDYLDRVLNATDAECFLAHLEDCAECRIAVKEHEALEALLQSATNDDAVPSHLVPETRRLIRQSGRRRLLSAAAGLAAAVLLAGILIGRPWFKPTPRPEEVVKQPAAPPSNVQVAQAVAPVRVAIESDTPLITLPLKSARPNITIIWVYPSAPTAPAVNREDTEQERNGS
jgi:anti-sigma factor RsiW